ncbi:DNA-binding response regulator, partial [Burkholderia cenocepacia]|nr:DNA-binding response regulator [Burkholderia cenocepacia]
MGSYLIRVVLADDHPAMLVGVEHGLSSVPTIQLTGKAVNSTELIRLVEAGDRIVGLDEFGVHLAEV